jgi:EAL domain-containing protein (putative c-di-GMP-specific phosphodiesterase class I)
MDGAASKGTRRKPLEASRVRRKIAADELAGTVDARLREARGIGAAATLALLFVRLARHDGRRCFLPDGATTEALDAASRRIDGVLRAEDRLCVLSPNELLVLLAQVPSEAVARLAMNRIQRALCAGHPDRDAPRAALPAIGAALASARSTDAEALVGLAERACATAAEIEDRQYLLASSVPEMEQADLAPEVRTAIEANRLEVHYQPKWHRRRRTCSSVEALVRWPRGSGAPHVETETLVRVARRHGYMQSLTRLVLNTALREIRELESEGIRLDVAVNLDPTLLSDAEFPGLVEQALDIWGAEPHRLTLEVTESTELRDSKAALRMLHELHRLGTRLSIDDFGTGHSSLARLRALPLSELKIDRMFVMNMERSQQDLQIVRSVIGLAHNFELEVVAEGVEDAATARHLCALDCDILQGYAFARPMPADAFRSWWRGRRDDESWLASAPESGPG